ncbi:MAG: hydroxyacid dehydrogenase [Alphaproteobacteria bacterium]
MKIYILDPISEDAIAYLASRHTVIRPDDPAAANWPEDADAIINRTRPTTAEQINAAKCLKIIAKHGIGVDHIDLDAAKARGIPVTNTPGTNARAVAELTVMMVIAAARSATAAERALRQGTAGEPFHWRGAEITGKRVGLVGLGNIGRAVTPMFRLGFGCTVAAVDPYLEDTVFETHGVTRYASVADMLPEVDILSLHCPLTPETRHLIDAAALAAMPPGAILVNTARGGIVHDDALADALENGPLAAAALDVFEREPVDPGHRLLTLPNLVATPHIGGHSHESGDRSGMAVAEIVLEVLDGKPPRNRMA